MDPLALTLLLVAYFASLNCIWVVARRVERTSTARLNQRDGSTYSLYDVMFGYCGACHDFTGRSLRGQDDCLKGVAVIVVTHDGDTRVLTWYCAECGRQGDWPKELT